MQASTVLGGHHNCIESEWRFLDCDDCDVCEIRVCVDCGKEVC
jgi:hypothetical protein